jgi:transcription elongation factor GreA
MPARIWVGETSLNTMMDVQELYLSKEGLAKLKEELVGLQQERVDVTQKIREAREFGDLSENAEYQEAKTKQAFIEGRVEEIESMLKTAKIIEDENGKTINGGEVRVGSKVTVKFNGREVVYDITGSNEASPAEGKISNESPLGRVLLGRRSGEKVILSTGDGDREYQVVKVS